MFKHTLLALATVSSMGAVAKQEAPIVKQELSAMESLAPISIAKTVSRMQMLEPSVAALGGHGGFSSITVAQPGASFIKVHFGQFKLPEGAYVTVSSADGSESYRYDGVTIGKATYDRKAGENGINRFSAMSVFGDRAIIQLVMPKGAQWKHGVHRIMVDSFKAGTENQQFGGIEAQMYDPASTCGVNERRDVACWETSHPVEFERTRPVARLLMGGSGLCTGWRVGNDNHMFTNNHCVDTQSGLANTEVWFNYQNTTCGGSTLSGTIKVTGKDLLKTDYNLDYTLFTVNNFSNISSFGNFGLDVRTPTQNERIYIPQHGSGNPKELSIEDDQSSTGLCKIDVAIENGRATDTDTGYMCDTIGGSSGSPVLAANSNKVIALHHFGGCTNQGVRMDLIWPQVSSYFGGNIPVGDNNSTGNQAPVAQANISCNDLACTFDGSGSSDSDGSVASHSWNLGDGTTLSGANVSHTYSAAGSYSVTLTVTDDQGATGSNTQTVAVTDGSTGNGELTSGVPVSNLSGATGAEAAYYINTTENDSTVTVTMSGGSGDADLYTKVGSAPTTSSYDCRPYRSGNNETCTSNVGTPGTVHIMLRGYSAYSGVTLQADVTTAPPSGFPMTGLSATTGNWNRATYTVPAGVSSVTVTTSGSNGDADLYTRKGAEPTTSSYDCRPYSAGSNESCNVTGLSQGDVVHIGVRAYSSYTDLTLNVQ